MQAKGFIIENQPSNQLSPQESSPVPEPVQPQIAATPSEPISNPEQVQPQIPAATSPGIVSPALPASKIWSKTIPLLNWVFLFIYLGFLLAIDLPILIGTPDLLAFYVGMLFVFGLFVGFFVSENFALKKKYSNNTSSLDGWIVTMVITRNVVVLLNVIPFIQIFGFIALFFGGLPYLIIYVVLLVKRNRTIVAG